LGNENWNPHELEYNCFKVEEVPRIGHTREEDKIPVEDSGGMVDLAGSTLLVLHDHSLVHCEYQMGSKKIKCKWKKFKTLKLSKIV